MQTENRIPTPVVQIRGTDPLNQFRPKINSDDLFAKLKNCRRLLLIEANNQRAWVGSRVAPEIHIPPVGLLYVATFARSHHRDVDIQILETSLEASTDAMLREKLLHIQPDIVGIRGITFFEDEFTHVSEVVKDTLSIPVIGGGPIATAKRGNLLKSAPAVDLLVTGEGELTLAHLLTGHAQQGIVGRSGDQIVDLGDGEIVNTLDELPFPDYSFIDISHYQQHLSYAYNYRRQGVLLTSRGCPFLCTYCNTFAGKKARLRSATNVVEEMQQLFDRWGIQDFYIVDDIFNIDRKRTEDIFRMILAKHVDWRLYFVNGLRADIMTRQLVDLMVDAGGVWVTYAIESGSPRIQALIKKRMHLDKALDIISYTQEKGVVVNVNTMYGFPTETAAEAQETLDCLARLRMPSILPYHFCLRGYEGCEIVQQAESAGWDTTTFVDDGGLAYHALPRGTPTFSRSEMLDHVVSYHAHFGMENKQHLRTSIEILRRNGYTDRDLVDMFSVLQNRPINDVVDV